MIYDTAVICGYFILMVLISFIFKKMASKSSSDYFRGGGRMLWWMVGATAFMTQFSAWTFTGAAGKAFSDGFLWWAAIFLGQYHRIPGISWLWFAKRFRQVRVDTATEVIRHRFGSQNEHFFTWVIIPLSILSGAVMMNALAIFVSTVFDLGSFGHDLGYRYCGVNDFVIKRSLGRGCFRLCANLNCCDYFCCLCHCCISQCWRPGKYGHSLPTPALLWGRI